MSEAPDSDQSGVTAGDEDTGAWRQRLARRDREIKALETALAAEQRMATKLRSSFEKLGERVGRLEQKLDQVTAERDQLSRQLGSADRMQTATLALEEGDAAGVWPGPWAARAQGSEAAPEASSSTISRLMAEIAALDSEPQNGGRPAAADPPPRDLVAPELMVPEAFGEEAAPQSHSRASGRGAYSSTKAARLIRLDGGLPREYMLEAAELTIGRAPEADIRIDELFVSRIHARVRVKGVAVTVEDVGSRNGVKVNSARIKGRHRLQDGDILGVGRLRLQFIDPGEAPVPASDD